MPNVKQRTDIEPTQGNPYLPSWQVMRHIFIKIFTQYREFHILYFTLPTVLHPTLDIMSLSCTNISKFWNIGDLVYGWSIINTWIAGSNPSLAGSDINIHLLLIYFILGHGYNITRILNCIQINHGVQLLIHILDSMAFQLNHLWGQGIDQQWTTINIRAWKSNCFSHLFMDVTFHPST